MLTCSHLIDDLYSGALPALLPFMVTVRHYTYVQASGVIVAATLLSSVVQPLFGVLADRYTLRWITAAGMTLAAAGIGLCGIFSSYATTCVAAALSGIGIAAYHPAATRLARVEGGSSALGMSLFSVGGNIGIALAPLLVAVTAGRYGIRAASVLPVPAFVMLIVLSVALVRWRIGKTASVPGRPQGNAGTTARKNDWPQFRVLCGVIISRSIGTSTISTFIALFVVERLHQTDAIGALALGVYNGFGIAGTLLGGGMADAIGRVRTVRIACLGSAIVLTAVVLSPTIGVALPLIALLGIAEFIPFSVQVTLGHEYLPGRLGTASGATLGLALTVGGAFTPLIGLIADSIGLRWALSVGAIAAIGALLVTLRLTEPQPLVTAALEPSS